MLQPIEGFIYCVIFWHVYRHEETVKPLLTEKSFRCRRKRNVLTMVCQFYIYVFKLAFTIGLLLIVQATEPSWHQVWFGIFVQTEFAVRCTVQALASSEARKELILINIIQRFVE